MKKIVLSSIGIFVLVAIVSAVNVRADYNGFAGSAGFTYARVSTENLKSNNEYLAGVNWTSSDKTGHKMWFRIRNSNQEERGKILISRPGNGVSYLETSAKNGHNYWLWSNREHFGNPATYVQGTWQP